MPAPLANESTANVEPNERRVHRERLGHAAADAGEHAVALHARDARERDRKPKRTGAHPRSTSSCAEADARVEHEDARRSVPKRWCASGPTCRRRVVPKSVTWPALVRPSTLTVTPSGTCTTRSPIPSVVLTWVCPTGNRTSLQLEVEVPDSLLVRRADRGERAGCATRSPMPREDRHPHDERDRERREHHEPERDDRADAAARRRARRDDAAEDDGGGGEHDPPVDVRAGRDVDERDDPEPADEQSAEQRPSDRGRGRGGGGRRDRARRCRRRRGGGRAAGAPVCDQTIAAPTSAAATQRLPGLGQTCADESATSPAKPSRPTPTSSHGRSRWCLIASAAIESSTPSSGMTSHAAT